MALPTDEHSASAVGKLAHNGLLIAARPIPVGSGLQAWHCIKVTPPGGVVPIDRLTARMLVAQGLARMQTTGKIFLVSHKFGPIPIII